MIPGSKPPAIPTPPASITMLAAPPATRSVFSSLRFRLALAVLVPFLAAASLILYETIDRRSYAVRHSRQEVARMLTSVEERERQALDPARQLLWAVTHLPSVRNLDAEGCTRLFAELRTENPRYATLALIGPDGSTVSSSIPNSVNVRGRTWYERAIKTRRLSVGTYSIGLVTGRPSLHLAQPLLAPRTEEVTAVLMAAVDLDYLAALLPTNLPAGTASYVLDSEGTILARGGAATEAVGSPFPHASSGTITETGPLLIGDREFRIGDGEHPLRVALSVPTAAVLRNSNAMANRAIVSLAVLALLSLAIWHLGDRLFVRRTRALVGVTRELGSGRLGARAAVPYDRGELGELERAVNAMADSIQRREAAILDSEGRFREIAETIQEAFWVLTPDARRITYVSPALEKIWGRPVGALDTLLDRFLDSVDPEDRARVHAALATMGEKGFREEFRIRRPSGEVRWVGSRALPVRTPEGTVVRVVGTTEDVTERKRIEEQFIQAQKMEALGRLAGGVAHDFNNLLTIISGYADILSMDEKIDDEMRQHLGEIIASSRRATSLTRQLLAFSRRQIVQKQAVDLNEILKKMEDMLRRVLGEDIKLTVGKGENLGLVLADPGHVEQSIMNLVVNARDAMPRGGSMRIETANVELDEAYAKDHTGVAPGSYIMLAVSDTGVGMDAATQARLFEPFFTTKEKGKGTGLGLATVYGIAKQFGGHIWVYSEPGRGSTFKIYFPRSASGVAESSPRDWSGPIRGGTETILLVEDDPNLRRLIVNSLRSRGYTILEAGDGAEAERISEGCTGALHLLLTDSVLPTLSGPALSRVLTARRPDLKVLFMSGYTDAGVFEQAGVEIGRAFLQKPFTVESLARKIREILDEARA